MRYYSSTASSKTLSSSVNTTATTITLNNLTGLPASYPYTLVLDPDTASEEIVLVTSLSSGTTLNVTRGTDTYQGITGGNGTAKQDHNSGAVVKHMITARDLQEPQDHIAASSGVHGLTGSVVGTSDAQTLTNKTISGSSNTVSISSANISDWTAQFNTKANLNGPTFTGTVVLPSTTSIGNVSSTELSYLDGVTSAIQTQISAKANTSGPTFTGTVVLPSTTSIGSVSSTELGYLDGVTSAIQTQLNGKQASLPSQTGNSGKYLTTDGTNVSWAAVSGTGVGDVVGPASSTTDNIVAFSNTTGKAIKDSGVATSNIATLSGTQTFSGAKTFSGTTTFTGNISANSLTISPTELGYLDGVTSAIQTQINDKANTSALSNYALLASPNFTGTVVLPSTTSIGNVSSTEIGYLDGVTAAIQTQLNNVTPLWYRRTADTASITTTATAMFATSPSLDASSWYHFKMFAYVAFDYTGSSGTNSITLEFSSAPTSVRASSVAVSNLTQFTTQITATTATQVTETMTGDQNNLIQIEGFFNTNLATTFNPKISSSAGSILVKEGSHIQIQKLAVSTAAINGTWT